MAPKQLDLTTYKDISRLKALIVIVDYVYRINCNVY